MLARGTVDVLSGTHKLIGFFGVFSCNKCALYLIDFASFLLHVSLWAFDRNILE